MTGEGAKIVRLALAARSADDAAEVQRLIERAVGGRFERPVGDRWNNQGLITQSGTSFEHKIIELVTNQQDALLERAALKRYGDLATVPYASPHQAARALLGHLNARELAGQALISINPCGDKGDRKKMTIVCRDQGCGMTPSSVPTTIFQIGAGHKDGVDWQQGTFGLGGATTYRNAESVVLVTRRDPELLGGDQSDMITVAVVQWSRHRTTVNAFYLATGPWQSSGDRADPYSVPAGEVPGFEPGTHLALIGFGSDVLGRKSGDDKSFQAMAETRLFRPVTPISYQNTFVRDRVETLYGLHRRLENNPADPGMSGSQLMPFNAGGHTFQMPVRFRLFNKPGLAGQRRNFVADGHAVIMTSNGQTHAHWSGPEFRSRTSLKKLSDRILVTVETDELPIEVRTTLFTADRSQLVRTSEAKRLEMELAAFLNDWPALIDVNGALIREEISSHKPAHATLETANKIARAFKVRGFAASTRPGNGKGKPPPPLRPIDLLADPTEFRGPHHVEARTGQTKSVYFQLNARDDFLRSGGRGTLEVTCDHPAIGSDEITVGQLQSGRVRVSVAVPDTDDFGTYELHATIPPWTKSSGGLGRQFDWTTKVELVDEIRPRPGKSKPGEDDGREGDHVALLWQSHDDITAWSASTVGVLEHIPALDLANAREEYASLAGLNIDIPTIRLNTTYSPLKAYVQARTNEQLSTQGLEQCRERYAVGVGVAMLCLSAEGELPEDRFAHAIRAATRGVLSVLPEYDRLAKETFGDDG